MIDTVKAGKLCYQWHLILISAAVPCKCHITMKIQQSLEIPMAALVPFFFLLKSVRQTNSRCPKRKHCQYWKYVKCVVSNFIEIQPKLASSEQFYTHHTKSYELELLCPWPIAWGSWLTSCWSFSKAGVRVLFWFFFIIEYSALPKIR